MSTLLSIWISIEFKCTWIILFNENRFGGVRDNFIGKLNDPLMNQHLIFLQIWMENCDLKIVLDEEQAIQQLMKYASKREQISHHMNEIMQSLLQNQPGNDGEDSPEEESKDEKPEPTDDTMGRTLIRKLAMKSIGIRNKSQQEIMHSTFRRICITTTFSL